MSEQFRNIYGYKFVGEHELSIRTISYPKADNLRAEFPDINIDDPSNSTFKELLEFDKNLISSVDRSEWIKYCVLQFPSSNVKIARNKFSGELLGYAQIRRDYQKDRMVLGPFYSKSSEAAEAILCSLLEDTKGCHSLKAYSMGSNAEMQVILSKLGKSTERARLIPMYNKYIPKINVDLVYSCGFPGICPV